MRNVRVEDLFVWLLVAGVLFIAAFGYGCAAAPPPPPKWAAHKIAPAHAVVALHGHAGWLCSGVAVGPHTVLTAKHCVANGTFDVEAFPGLRSQAMVVAVDPVVDLAEVYVANELQYQAERAAYLPLLGTIVYAAGFGCERERVQIHVGAYLGFDSDMDLVAAMGTCFGDSGGPVFDDQGRVFALLSERALPPDVPLAFFASLITIEVGP